MDAGPDSSRTDLDAAIVYGACTTVGQIRTDNQDSYGVFADESSGESSRKGRLFVVADGMGGHRGGSEASAVAVAVLRKTFYESPDADVLASLRESFRTANAAIYERSQMEANLKGMGTTCTALVLANASLYIGHIGDSRAYQITSTGITQLTEDHSRAEELLRSGLITAEQAKTHPERSMLLRALGVAPAAHVDLSERCLDSREIRCVLCTDGLSGLVEDAEIQETVWLFPPQEACDRLIGQVNMRGGHDNATVIVVRIQTQKKLLERLAALAQRL